MKQTDQYKLNQWDPTDRILREDFNADNLKLDAALAGKIGKMNTIWVTKAKQNRYKTGSTSAVPEWMKNYDYYAVAFDIKTQEEDADKKLRLKFSACPTPEIVIPVQPFIVLYFPHYDITQKFRCLLICEHPRYFISDVTYEEKYDLMIQVENGESIQDFEKRYIGWK